MDKHDLRSTVEKLLDDAIAGKLIENRPSKPLTRAQVENLRRRELLKALAELIEDRDWFGSASDLASVFERRFSSNGYRPRKWPTTPAGTALLLRKYWPDLCASGIDVGFFWSEEPGTRRPVYRISRLKAG